MRTAIIGATGNVGSRLTEVLSEDPDFERVVAVARRRPEVLPADVEWRAADLARPLPPGLLDGVDAVVHLAWLFQPSHAPTTTWTANVEGTIRLLGAAVEAGITTFVHASSVGAYSPRQNTQPVDESWPTHGVATAAYSVEKAYVERVLDRFELEHPDIRVVRMRPAFIFRPESSVQQRRLFLGPLAPTKLVTRTGVPLLPDPGGLLLQALHTDDAADAYRRALTSDVAGPLNIATDPPLTMADIAAELGGRAVKVPAGASRTLLRVAWAAHLLPASPGMFDLVQHIPMLDSSRAREELGWVPRHTGQEAIAAVVQGMRTGTGAATPPLDPRTSGPFRIRELRSGIGQRP